MAITNVRREVVEGRAVLRFELDGRPVTLWSDLKRTLLEQGLVFLGPEWEGRVAVYLGENAADGRPGALMNGFTNDAAVVAAARAFVEDVDAGRFP